MRTYHNIANKMIEIDFKEWSKHADVQFPLAKPNPPEKKKRRNTAPDDRPQKQQRTNPQDTTNKWAVGRIIVVNPPQDATEKYWLAKIQKKVNDSLSVQWFDRLRGSMFGLTSVDEIPLQSVYEDLYPELQNLEPNVWNLKNENEIKAHVSKFR